MDPLAVLKTLWTYKFWVLPVLIITIASGVYVYQFGPRSYESSMSVAVVNPTMPSERELEKNPALAKLNKDNPYLRSSDPSLITDVMVTQLKSASTAAEIEAAGLGPEYSVGQGVNSNGFVIDISGVASTPENAVATAVALGKHLEKNLYDAQKINGADDMYLFTSLTVVAPEKPTEQFSSRLRSVIVVFIGGAVLMLTSVSLGVAFRKARLRKQARKSASKHNGSDEKTADVSDDASSHAVAEQPDTSQENKTVAQGPVLVPVERTRKISSR